MDEDEFKRILGAPTDEDLAAGLTLTRLSHDGRGGWGERPSGMACGNSLRASPGVQYVRRAGAINRAPTSRTAGFCFHCC